MELRPDMRIVVENEDLVYKTPAVAFASAPLVTVVVQCYNRTDFLDETVASAAGQTFREYELIVFDNGSSPEQSAKIEAIALRYRASYLRATRNGHGDNIRRLILPLVSTKYVAILHDDDKWQPDKLANSIGELEEKSLDYVFTNKQYIDAYGNLLPSVDNVDAAISDFNYAVLKPEQVVEHGLFRSNVLHWSSLVIRKEVLWREFAKYACFYRIGDWMFFCHLVMSDHLKGSCMETRDTLIRIHGNNDFSYQKFSPIKRVLARTKLCSDEMHFFNDVLNYPEEKFARVFEKYLQGDHGEEHRNRCYLDVSFRISEWLSPSWIYFSKRCFLKAIDLDPADTHAYLFSRYKTYGDDFVSQLDTTYFVRNMALCVGFLPSWMINLVIRGVHWLKRLRGDGGYLPPIGQYQMRTSPKPRPSA